MSLYTPKPQAQAEHSIDKDRVKNLTLLPSTVPCGKVLVWQSPVALAIRQGRLISPSEIHGGSADRLNKQQVSLPTGEQELHTAAGEKGKQVPSKEPGSGDLLILPSRDTFSIALKDNYQELSTVAMLCFQKGQGVDSGDG